MSLSRKERQEQKQQGSSTQTEQERAKRLAQIDLAQQSRKKMWLCIGLGIGGVFLLGVIMSTIVYFSPGPVDDFAKCLTDKGAKMYGAMGWCKYTQGQKAMFGKSFRHVDYEEHTEYPVEQYGKIDTTPTWIINDKPYENARTLKELSELTGCPLP